MMFQISNHDKDRELFDDSTKFNINFSLILYLKIFLTRY